MRPSSGVRGVDSTEQQRSEVDLEARFLYFDEADSLTVERPADEVVRATEDQVAPFPRRKDFVPVLAGSAMRSLGGAAALNSRKICCRR